MPQPAQVACEDKRGEERKRAKERKHVSNIQATPTQNEEHTDHRAHGIRGYCTLPHDLQAVWWHILC